jgi:hypothetical protein
LQSLTPIPKPQTDSHRVEGQVDVEREHAIQNGARVRRPHKGRIPRVRCDNGVGRLAYGAHEGCLIFTYLVAFRLVIKNNNPAVK